MSDKTNQHQVNMLYGIKEISLLLYKKKLSVALITLLFFGLTLVYSLLDPPIYRATATVVPPSNFRASALDMGKENPSWTGEDLFNVFRKHILDPYRRKMFFESSSVAALIGTDSSEIQIGIDFDKNNRLTLHVDGPNVDLAEMLATRYIEFSEASATNEIISEVMSILDMRDEKLRKQIDASKIAEEKRIEIKVQLLEEAKKIAEEIGQYEFDPRAPAIPLFSRGVKALEAEIRSLRSQTIATIDLPEILRYRNERTAIENLKTDTNWRSHTKSALVQLKPFANSKPIWPKYPLIWTLGFAIGLLISIVVVISGNKLGAIRAGHKK